MRTWTTTTTVGADPVAVLDVLTDPQACRRWAPVAFDVSDLQDDRLSAGSRARVTGRLAGRSVGFDVHVGPPASPAVPRAADGRLALSADGPVALDRTTGFAGGAPHDLAAAPGGSEVRASVGLRPRGGLLGRVLAEATAGLLAAGPRTTGFADGAPTRGLAHRARGRSLLIHTPEERCSTPHPPSSR